VQIRTPQVKLALRIEAATVEDDVLVLRGLAGFLPCEARITAPEVRHLLSLLLRRASLPWIVRSVFRRAPQRQE
jgi:hypothetical protein